MISKATLGLLLILLLGGIASVSMALYYRGNAIDYKDQRDKASDALKHADAIINDMQTRQRDVAALDAKYTKELADANTENDRLRSKLASGGRVRVAGKCEASATTSSSMGNAGAIELSSGAGSNVLDIRAGIISDQSKVRYLQQYITEQCLK